jgi:prophage antirepressor-like protein
MDFIEDDNTDKIRIIVKDGIEYFAAIDICNILGMKNARQAVSQIDQKTIIHGNAIDTLGRRQIINYVNDSGLYQLIYRSRKSSIEKFKMWVTHEVLPSIRKTGKYCIPDEETKNFTEFIFSKLQLLKTNVKKKNYVYLLFSEHGVKIGYSLNPKERISQISVQMPFEITRIENFEVENMSYAEGMLHERYKNKRLNGEWFNLSDKDIDEIIEFLSGI